jgi:hypothetical protein
VIRPGRRVCSSGPVGPPKAGGYNWKARFIGKDGFIITGEEGDSEFLGQYNFANPVVGNDAHWVTYNAGKQKAYNCGPCHTTGYSAWPPDARQDGLPGLIGTWAEPGITCEACHGPGSLHVENPHGVALKVERSSAACGECHVRGSVEAVNASGGFIRHHEQYEELFQSKHVVLDCVICHDPHDGVVALRRQDKPTTRTTCVNCHYEQGKYQASAAMVASGVECIDCHMPRVTKSAVGNAAKYNRRYPHPHDGHRSGTDRTVFSRRQDRLVPNRPELLLPQLPRRGRERIGFDR